MNDVLPKPFTKEGLLNMLEKHLGHLKKGPHHDCIDTLAPQPAPTAHPMAHQSSTTHSLKDESSPGESPSTVTNWNSPSAQFPGLSPTIPTTHYMHPIHPHPLPHPPPGYAIDHSPLQYQTPHTPLAAPPHRQGQPQTQHRRQLSEMSGPDDLLADAKRQRVLVQNAGGMGNPMQRRPG